MQAILRGMWNSWMQPGQGPSLHAFTLYRLHVQGRERKKHTNKDELLAQVTLQRSQRALAMFWESVPKVAQVLLLKDEGIHPETTEAQEIESSQGRGTYGDVTTLSVTRQCWDDLGQLGFAWLSITLHEPQEVPHEEACEESHPYLSLPLSGAFKTLILILSQLMFSGVVFEVALVHHQTF